MQLVRTAQPKHKINLLSLSTEAGGPDVGHLVCSINSMQFVRTAQFKHKHLLALYSHSPRRTGGPQAPASGALVRHSTTIQASGVLSAALIYTINISVSYVAIYRHNLTVQSSTRSVYTVLSTCPLHTNSGCG